MAAAVAMMKLISARIPNRKSLLTTAFAVVTVHERKNNAEIAKTSRYAGWPAKPAAMRS
jgi:hypothetical protein